MLVLKINLKHWKKFHWKIKHRHEQLFNHIFAFFVCFFSTSAPATSTVMAWIHVHQHSNGGWHDCSKALAWPHTKAGFHDMLLSLFPPPDARCVVMPEAFRLFGQISGPEGWCFLLSTQIICKSTTKRWQSWNWKPMTLKKTEGGKKNIEKRHEGKKIWKLSLKNSQEYKKLKSF